MAERGDDEIEMTRASLAAKASRWQARLEQHQAELEACRAGGGEDVPDCSAYARAVEQTGERLEHIRRWQQRVDQEAGEFGGTASGFRDLLEVDLPRAESQLLAIISRLEAARRVPAGEALPPCTPGRTAKGMSSSACSAPPGRRRSPHWQDEVARRFDTDHWTPLVQRSRAYLEALRTLMDVLETAERDTEF